MPLFFLFPTSYCNSHLIVLGLIEKKVKKKKPDGAGNDAQGSVKSKDQHQNKVAQKSKEEESGKIDKVDKHKSKLPENKGENKPKPKPPPPMETQSTLVPVPQAQWNPYYQIWRRVRKRQRPRKKNHVGNVMFPKVEVCRKVCKEFENESKDLLKNYSKC